MCVPDSIQDSNRANFLSDMVAKILPGVFIATPPTWMGMKAAQKASRRGIKCFAPVAADTQGDTLKNGVIGIVISKGLQKAFYKVG